MPLFQSPDFDAHEEIVFCTDDPTGLRAIIGIHNTALGPAFGGCRMWPYHDEQSALNDVLRLSRGMTFKAALANVPFGGGKAVILGDPKECKTPELLRAMGRAIQKLDGRYQTAEDVGTTVADMDILRTVTPHAHGIAVNSGNPSPATAYGVFLGIRAAVAHKYGHDCLRDIHVAVQGLGNVGYRLCQYLAEDGARLTVTDIDKNKTTLAESEFDARSVAPDEIYGVEADVFAPCALGAVINDDTIPRLKAGIVAGAANNQLGEKRHGCELHRCGILYAPDYVINAGGLIDVTHEGPCYDERKVLMHVEMIKDTLNRVFDVAKHTNAAPGQVADKMAVERIKNAAGVNPATEQIH